MYVPSVAVVYVSICPDTGFVMRQLGPSCLLKSKLHAWTSPYSTFPGNQGLHPRETWPQLTHRAIVPSLTSVGHPSAQKSHFKKLERRLPLVFVVLCSPGSPSTDNIKRITGGTSTHITDLTLASLLHLVSAPSFPQATAPRGLRSLIYRLFPFPSPVALVWE